MAVKVQRPHMSHLLTLDAMLFHMIGGQLKRFAKARKDLLVAVNEMVRFQFPCYVSVLQKMNLAANVSVGVMGYTSRLSLSQRVYY